MEARRKMEIEGYQRDIEMVKRKIRIYDEYLHRVKKLINENPKEAVKLATNQEEKNELDISPLKDQVQKLEEGLEKLKEKAPAEPELEELPVREEEKKSS